MDIPTYVNVKLLLSPGTAGGLPFLFKLVMELPSDKNGRRPRCASASWTFCCWSSLSYCTELGCSEIN